MLNNALLDLSETILMGTVDPIWEKNKPKNVKKKGQSIVQYFLLNECFVLNFAPYYTDSTINHKQSTFL